MKATGQAAQHTQSLHHYTITPLVAFQRRFKVHSKSHHPVKTLKSYLDGAKVEDLRHQLEVVLDGVDDLQAGFSGAQDPHTTPPPLCRHAAPWSQLLLRQQLR